MAVYAGPEIIENGLVLSLDAGNRKSYSGSGTTWTDLSGNGNNGTLTNGPTYSSANGGSIVFDGSDDYVDVDLFTFNTSSVYTASCWFRLNNNTIQQYLLDLRTADNTGASATIAYNQNGTSGKIHYTVYGDSVIWPSAPTILFLSTWYNVVVIHNSSTNNIKIYLNSVLGLDTTFVTDLTVTSSPLRIGARRFTGTNQTNGNIASTQIYNRALTASEVQQNFNALRGRFGI